MLIAALTLGAHLLTAHDTSSRPASYPGLNDKNPGVYVRTHDGFTAGMYFNSYARMTRYAGFTWTQAHVWGDYSLTAALATGYNGPVSPMVLPSVRLGPARLTGVPGIGPVHNALHLSVEWQVP